MLFISHSTKDDETINRLADALERAGYATWVDHRKGLQTGDPSWDREIREAIRGATAGIFVMSPNSLGSDICGSECLLVRELKKPLYVLRLAHCEPADVWLYIKQIQYADLVSDFNAGLQSLMDALNGKQGEGIPTPVRGGISGGDVMRLHLPYLKNPLRGRDADLELVRDAIGTGVFQVVGSGGLGKSRLCAEIAMNHPHGMVWHRCSSISISADLLTLLRQHLNLPDDTSQEVILSNLGDTPPLIIVDNAEDVIEERRKAYADLLTQLAGRGVPVLLTTRNSWQELKPRREHMPHALSAEVATQIALDFAKLERIELSEANAEILAVKARLHPRLIEFAVGQLHERRYERIIRQLDELTHEDIREALDEMIIKTLRQMCDQADNGKQADALLRRLTILQDTFTLEAVQALAQVELADLDDLEDALETLQRWQFVRRDHQTDHYTLAALVREALGVPTDEAVFDAYADFFTTRADVIFTLPQEEWHLHDVDLADITALGDALTRRTENGASGDLQRAVMFAYYIGLYILHRPQAVQTSTGARLRGMEWLETGLNAVQKLRIEKHEDEGLIKYESSLLHNIGIVWDDLGEKQQALEFSQQALPLLRAVGDHGGEAGTLNNIGMVWSDLGDKQQALDFFQQALPLFRAVGDRTGEAGTLNNIGGVWGDLGDQQQALVFYQQALPLFRAVGDRGGEATILNNIGGVWSALGDQQQALEFYQQALPLRRAVGDCRGEATTLNNIGRVWDTLGDKQQALPFYQQALPLFRAVGDRRGEAGTLNNIGNVRYALGNKQQALDFYQQALPLHRAVGNRGGEAVTLDNIGRVWHDLGDHQQALNFFQQALPLFRAVGNRSGEAGTLDNIGLVWDDLGDHQQALDFYQQALTLLRAVGDRGGEAGALNNIGGVWYALGDQQQALEFYQQALSLFRAVGDRRGEATTLNNIGKVWSDLGDKQQALHFYQQALPLFRAIGDRRTEATTLNNIGIVWSNLGDQQQALDFYQQALPLLRAVGDRRTEAVTCFNMGMLYHRLGDLDKAIEYVERCVALKQQIQHPNLESDRHTLNQLKAMRDQNSKAPPHHEEATATIEEIVRQLAEIYMQGGADAVREALKGKLPDEIIEELIQALKNRTENDPQA